VCQAACSLCARETDPDFKKDRQHHLSMDQILRVFGQEKIRQLDKMFMCGNYGDPAAGKHTLDIFQEFRRINPDVILGMNTNGAIQTTFWWYELAKILNQPQDYVVFSIDGLESTNATYRRNVIWNKLMSNARSFVEAGGSAHWDMLVYEHNQHQVEIAQGLAKSMGFNWFRAKVSKRFQTAPIEFLKPPMGYDLPNVNNVNTSISCHALNEQSVYIAADGSLLPCCWFGAEVFTLDNHAKHLLDNWNQRLVPSWQESPHRICRATCSQDTTGTSFSKQWKIEQQLK
jgi:MoaA/NifB/PqqE/SkfB family radical SAM enzyme